MYFAALKTFSSLLGLNFMFNH